MSLADDDAAAITCCKRDALRPTREETRFTERVYSGILSAAPLFLSPPRGPGIRRPSPVEEKKHSDGHGEHVFLSVAGSTHALP